MPNNIVDNIRVDSILLHSDYPYQDDEMLRFRVFFGIDVLRCIKPYSHEELWVYGKKS